MLEAPGGTPSLWKFATWLSNLVNQAAVAEGGAVLAAAIDPNPRSTIFNRRR